MVRGELVTRARKLLLPCLALYLGGCAHGDEAAAAPAKAASEEPAPSESDRTSASVSRIVLGAQGEAPSGDGLSYVAGWRVVSFEGPKLGLEGVEVQAACGWVRSVSVERAGDRRSASVLQPCQELRGATGTVERDDPTPALEKVAIAAAFALAVGFARTSDDRVFPALPASIKEPPLPKPVLFLDRTADETLVWLRESADS